MFIMRGERARGQRAKGGGYIEPEASASAVGGFFPPSLNDFAFLMRELKN